MYIKGKNMKPGEKRIVYEVDRQLHLTVKSHSAKRGMSMKSWIIMAIVQLLEKEIKQCKEPYEDEGLE